MRDDAHQGELAPDQSPITEWELALANAVRTAAPPLLYGLRLWASVCLALYVAFWLELDNPFWAGTSAAIICQPQLGASLRKGWFRMIGTVVGALVSVVLTACFPQDRIAFLALLALWGGLCAFGATVLRNFASYAAALAGYTAVIIAAGTLGATGGASPEVFWVAVYRASEICIGIVCAGIILAGTDLGGAQRRLAALFAALAAETADQFCRMLALAGPHMLDTRPQQRKLAHRFSALDPAIDQAIGESRRLRYHSRVLQTALHGLFTALSAWHGVATHLTCFPANRARQEADAILHSLPAELIAASHSDASTRWMADPVALRGACEASVRALLALPTDIPLQRLLADETAKLLTGLSHVLDSLALLIDAPDRPSPSYGKFRLTVPDWLPALVSAGRAFVAIGAVELFWVVSAWPNGSGALVFVSLVTLLLSPRGDQAYAGGMALALGVAASVVVAAIVKFAVLPALETFPAFCAAIGLVLIPAGFGMTSSQKPLVSAVLAGMVTTFMPLLAPTNEMTYDTAQYYNSALAVFAGCAAALMSFRLLPPLSPALRTRRLLALSLRDLRRLATGPVPRTPDAWDRQMYGRLSALPDNTEPLQRLQLMAALSMGAEIIHLRQMARHLGIAVELDAALESIVQGHSAVAAVRLRQLDRHLAYRPGGGPDAAVVLRVRGGILAISEALAWHAAFFDAGAPA